MDRPPTPPGEPGPAPERPLAALALAGAWHAVTCGALLGSPVALAADLARGRGADDLCQRLGAAPRIEGAPAWLHAASVGELSVATPVIAALRAERPGLALALSTMTVTGRATASRLRGHLAADPFLAPIDAAPCVARALTRLRPRALITFEAEIWPNLWAAAARQGVPIALAGGRISARHFPRYLKARPLIAPALRAASVLLMRTDEDAERILALGAPSARVRVTGNLKFDAALATRQQPDIEWAARAGLHQGPWLMLASTGEGEEAPLLDAFARLARRWPALRCLVAPRRQERWDEVARLVEARGLPLVRRSRGPAPVPASGVLLLDSLGELARLYRHATLVIVGRSFVPEGGSSLIEPAAAGRPVLFGPHVDNFKDARDALSSAGGGQAVTIESFEEIAAMLLGDDARREAMGRAALDAVRASEGATRRTVDALVPVLDRAEGPS